MADSSVAHAWKEADLTPSPNCITVFLTLGSWDRTSLLGMAILKGEITLKKSVKMRHLFPGWELRKKVESPPVAPQLGICVLNNLDLPNSAHGQGWSLKHPKYLLFGVTKNFNTKFTNMKSPNIENWLYLSQSLFLLCISRAVSLLTGPLGALKDTTQMQLSTQSLDRWAPIRKGCYGDCPCGSGNLAVEPGNPEVAGR